MRYFFFVLTWRCDTGEGGIDGDGDITRPENISAFRNFVLESTEKRGLHFLMADGVSWLTCVWLVMFDDDGGVYSVRYGALGEMWVVVCLITQGFSVEGQENLQEILSKQLLLCQLLTALSVVRTGAVLCYTLPPPPLDFLCASLMVIRKMPLCCCCSCCPLHVCVVYLCFQEATLCVRRLTCSRPSAWVWSICCISASRECRSSNRSPADPPTPRGQWCRFPKRRK